MKKEPDVPTDQSKPQPPIAVRIVEGNRVVSIKRELSDGDIVSVDDRYLGLEDLENVIHPPTFYGTVQNLLRYDIDEVKEVDEH